MFLCCFHSRQHFQGNPPQKPSKLPVSDISACQEREHLTQKEKNTGFSQVRSWYSLLVLMSNKQARAIPPLGSLRLFFHLNLCASAPLLLHMHALSPEMSPLWVVVSCWEVHLVTIGGRGYAPQLLTFCWPSTTSKQAKVVQKLSHSSKKRLKWRLFAKIAGYETDVCTTLYVLLDIMPPVCRGQKSGKCPAPPSKIVVGETFWNTTSWFVPWLVGGGGAFCPVCTRELQILAGSVLRVLLMC